MRLHGDASITSKHTKIVRALRAWIAILAGPRHLPMRRILLIVLLVLNAVVLLGQLWPEGAPPFARTVNIIFLVGVMAYLLSALLRKR
jgi:hypothetical protein